MFIIIILVVNNPTKEIALPIDTSTIATKFALDIVNEILENAMDAATTKSSLTSIFNYLLLNEFLN